MAGKKKNPSDVAPVVGATIAARTAAADARAYDAARKRRSSEKRKAKGFAAVRPRTVDAIFDDLDGQAAKPRTLPPAHAVAARIMLAAAVDAEPGLAAALAGSDPIVLVVDVADPAVLTSLQTWWTGVLAPGVRIASARNVSENTAPGTYGALDLFVTERPKPSKKTELALAATVAFHLGARIFAFSPDARAHLPDVLVATADFRIAVGPLDAGVVREVVRTVTGRACRVAIDGTVCGHLGILDLSAAVVTRRRDAPGRVVRRGLRRADEGTYAFFFDQLRIVLAGRAAEEVLIGTLSDGAAGTNPASDLCRASAMAMHVVATSGLDGPRPLLILPDRGGPFADLDVIKAADALLTRAAESARLLLSANRPALEEIARRLERDGSVDGAEAEAILSADAAPEVPAETRI
jgi:hypothetical protein